MSGSNASLYSRSSPANPPPPEQTSSDQARFASSPTPNVEPRQRCLRIANCPTTSLTLPSPSAQSESLRYSKRFTLDPCGTSHFDVEFRTPCSSSSSNQSHFPPLIPAPTLSQENAYADHMHLLSRPPGSAVSSDSRDPLSKD